MGRSVNKVIILGNVGGEPEIRTTGGGTKLAKFSVATNESWTDNSGQRQERTEWHRCVAWDKLADIVEQYVQKGDKIYIEGSLKYSQTEDDKGNVKYYTDITVREISLLGTGGATNANAPTTGGQRSSAPAPRKRAGAPRRPAPAGQKAPNPFDADDDDLPF